LKNISVIISTFSVDRLEYVLSCIESLKKQVLLPKEIFLVLDPDDNLVDFYKSHIPREISIKISEDYGLCNARNAGVDAATGEIVAFIDDDAVADENWLKELVTNYRNPDIVGVCGHVQPLWEDLIG